MGVVISHKFTDFLYAQVKCIRTNFIRYEWESIWFESEGQGGKGLSELRTKIFVV
jgi:hypothetical protein